MSTKTEELQSPTDIDTTTESFTLILYNDNYHSFEEVIDQVIKATGYGYDKAETITMEVHTKGKAAVVSGDLNKCIRAQRVLEEINLRTSIEVNA
jgi:ATP-dependent Clp protease adaptor protein ClpS